MKARGCPQGHACSGRSSTHRFDCRNGSPPTLDSATTLQIIGSILNLARRFRRSPDGTVIVMRANLRSPSASNRWRRQRLTVQTGWSSPAGTETVFVRPSSSMHAIAKPLPGLPSVVRESAARTCAAGCFRPWSGDLVAYGHRMSSTACRTTEAPAPPGKPTTTDADADEVLFQGIAAGTVGDNGFGTFEPSTDGERTFTLDNNNPAVHGPAYRY